MEKRHPSLNHLANIRDKIVPSQVPLCEMNASRNVSDPIDRSLHRSLLLIFDYPGVLSVPNFDTRKSQKLCSIFYKFWNIGNSLSY